MHAQCISCRKDRAILARAMCPACYHRAWRSKGFDPHSYIQGSATKRFWAYVDPSNRCWEWLGARNRWGYGVFTVDTTWDIHELAHRFAYGLFFGPPPAHLHVCHGCDNPGCVRPDHLFLGTGTENERDKIAKGRKHSQSGEANSQARLSPEGVREIRRLSAIGMDYREIALLHSVSPDCVRNVLSGKTWRSVA